MSAEADEAAEGSPWVEREAARRRRNLLAVGVALVAVFLLPGGPRGGRIQEIFLSVGLLLESEVPALIRFSMAFPLLAGLVAIGLAFARAGRERGIAMAALGMLPVLLLAGPGGHESYVTWLSGEALSGEARPETEALLVASLLSWPALLVAARCGWYRPKSLAAAVTAVFGAVCFLVALAVGLGQHVAASERAQTYWRVSDEELATIVLAALAVACMLAAAVLCVAGALSRSRSKARSLAWAAFVSVAFATCFGLACSLPGLFDAPRDPEVTPLTVLALLVKLAAFGLGAQLLLAMGVTDMVIGAPREAK